jgi:hypothetical protein
LLATEKIPTTDLLSHLHWLPVAKRIYFKIATLTRKVTTTQQPAYLRSRIHYHVHARELGSSASALQTVFQATAIAKLAYASPAWWGFASAADRTRIEVFLRRSVHFGYRADTAPTFASICAAADDKLFALIKSNWRHLLPPLFLFTK